MARMPTIDWLAQAECLGFLIVRPSSPPAIAYGAEEASVTLDNPSSREVLKEAQRLLHQILTILHEPRCESSSSASSFGLARAHARTLSIICANDGSAVRLRYTRACLDAAQRWPPQGSSTRINTRASKSVRVFELEWIERILAQAHPITPILWFGPILFVAAYRTLKGDPVSRLVAVPLFLGGWLAWSLVEYALHRLVFHMGARTPEQRLRAFLLHGIPPRFSE